MLQHRLGWTRDLPDHRDYRLVVSPPASLPPSVDLRPQLPPVYDQGPLGACTGNAIAAAVQYERRRQQLPDWVPSRLFVYYGERVIEHTIHTDSGAQIRDGMKVIATKGVCPEPLCPYDVTKFTHTPSKAAFAEALKHPATTYYRVLQTRTGVRSALAAGYPVIFGFTVYESFESDLVAHTGVVPMPSTSESVLGGHAVVAVGYLDATEQFLCRNSWGPSWGDGGYFHLPYDYLLNPNLAADLWTVQLVGGH